MLFVALNIDDVMRNIMMRGIFIVVEGMLEIQTLCCVFIVLSMFLDDGFYGFS